MKKFLEKLIYGPGITPLPWYCVMIAFLGEITNGMTKTSVFTYLPKLVKSFGVSEEDTGSVAGFISSAMLASSFLFSFLIGYLTDRFNKKYLLICTSLFGAIASLVFGFTTSITYALILRFIQGIPGILITAQALLFSKCDKTNKSIAMAFCLSAFCFGMVLGPAIGGFFAFPTESFQYFPKGTIFDSYPILLPNILLAVCFLVLSICTCFLQYDHINPESYSNLDEKEDIRLLASGGEEKMYNNEGGRGSLQDSFFIASHEEDAKISYNILQKPDGTFEKIKSARIFKVFSNKNAMLCSISYMCFGFNVTGFNELYPLWVSTSTDYNGLGFTVKEVGESLMIACIPLIFLLIIIISKLSQRFGMKKMYMGSLAIQSVLVVIFPTIKYVPYKSLVWILLVIFIFVIRILYGAAFTAAIVIITSSVHKDLLGTVNGVAVAFMNISSAVAPYAYGTMYSWSLRNIKGITKNTDPLGFPFDPHFPYIVMSVVSLVVLALVYFVKEIEFSDDDEKSTDYASTATSSSSSITSSLDSTPIKNSAPLDNSYENSLKTEKSRLIV
uniref:Major facilitator superfamily (MFS) profile domain-containing protein n=1 Tax=Clytia hemisphaerica TaxID=252671 RepID=A0A7M5UYR5_9CNID